MQELHFSHLIDILGDHDISYDHSSVESAFKGPDSYVAIESWIRSELDSKNLLTKDELSLSASPAPQRLNEAD